LNVASGTTYAVLDTDGNEISRLVAFTLAPVNEWLPVRRVQVDAIEMNQLVLSDGTIFVRERDPLVTFNDGTLISCSSGALCFNCATNHLSERIIATPLHRTAP